MIRPRARVPRLHVVTDDRVLAREDVVAKAEAVLAAGGPRVALHLRGPGTHGRVLWELARRLRGPATAAGAILLVNDRVDVARLAGADGVHLGKRSLPVEPARSLLPAGALVGVSVHDVEGAAAAAVAGADYLLVGTIFGTPSHPGRPGRGVDLIRRVAAAARPPLLAIGGVSPERASDCLVAGAHGVAVLRGVWTPADTEKAMRGYLEAMGARTGPAPAAGWGEER